ncbi:Putative membrane protein insertion efficiency factor [Streptomyces tendae]
MKYPLLALIKLYQWTISPLLGPVCKYYPSCSHYGYTAIDRHGAVKGTAVTRASRDPAEAIRGPRTARCCEALPELTRLGGPPG